MSHIAQLGAAGVDVAEAGDERHDQLGLLDGGEHTRDRADADAGRTRHEDVPAEEPSVQREEAAGVVDDLLVGELTEIWAGARSGDRPGHGLLSARGGRRG